MLNVAIMSIGNELMNGSTIDTNSSWLAKKISSFESLKVTSKITVEDDINAIKTNLDFLIKKKYKFIFITGGLGPTHDDVTKETLSSYFKTKIILKESYLNELKKKFKKQNIENISHLESQAQILDISTSIPNKKGTALGMCINKGRSQIFVLPGVPLEMKDMIKKEVIPLYIEPYHKHSINSITILTTGIYESKLYDILKEDIQNNINKFNLSFLPNYSGVKIRISKINYNINKREFSIFKNIILDKINKYVYGFNNDSLDKIVANLLIDKKLTISVAESCTGGYLSKKLTNYPNSTKFFKGSIVAYSNQIKINTLKVSKDVILKYGAVSENVALQMAYRIKNEFNTDIGLAITGISGPGGGSIKKPVGMVCIAIVFGKKETVKTFNLKVPDRKIHQSVSVDTSLNMIRLLLVK